MLLTQTGKSSQFAFQSANLRKKKIMIIFFYSSFKPLKTCLPPEYRMLLQDIALCNSFKKMWLILPLMKTLQSTRSHWQIWRIIETHIHLNNQRQCCKVFKSYNAYTKEYIIIKCAFSFMHTEVQTYMCIQLTCFTSGYAMWRLG